MHSLDTVPSESTVVGSVAGALVEVVVAPVDATLPTERSADDELLPQPDTAAVMTMSANTTA